MDDEFEENLARAWFFQRARTGKVTSNPPRGGSYMKGFREFLLRGNVVDMAIGIVSEAQTAAAVLGHNFPDSPWYKDAYNLVRSGGVEPSENQGSYISKAFKKLGLG